MKNIKFEHEKQAEVKNKKFRNKKRYQIHWARTQKKKEVSFSEREHWETC